MLKKITHQIDPKFSKIICLAINYYLVNKNLLYLTLKFESFFYIY